jgi:hypothetical protein
MFGASAVDEESIEEEMKMARPLAEAPGGYVYSAAVSAAQPAADYAARIIPLRSEAAVPLESARILWQQR